MPYPDKITLGYSYTGFAQGLGNGSFPGSQLDADLAQVATDTNSLNDFVRNVVRSDGKLQNGIVNAESFAADARAAFNSTWVPKGNWATATDYAVGDVVNTNANTLGYLCLVAHTSSGLFATDLAAGRWLLMAAQGVPASGSAVVPSGNIASTDVQAALYELDAEKQAVAVPLTAISAVTPAADRVPYFTGASTAAVAPLTAFGRTLIDDVDAATARTTLGLGSFATLSAVPDNTLTTAKYQDASVTTAKIADASVTGLKLAAGVVIQSAGTIRSTVGTGTTLIPVDDTIPQITEGDEYMTLAFTPQFSTSTLEITVVLNATGSTTSGNVTVALFQDSGADALAAVTQVFTGAGFQQNVSFTHRVSALSTAARTFRVRAGLASAGTMTVNGASGARLFGGTYTSSLTVREIKG